jgi:uncharacterized membrane protein
MMASVNYPVALVARRQPFHTIFLPFPIVCFTLAAFTDVAYWQTGNLMWQNFSSWLLFVGLIVGCIAALAAIVDFFVSRLIAPAWPRAVGGAVVLVLAFINNLVHAGDGWTAVVPYGLILSVATVVVMIIAAWFFRSAPYRCYRDGGRDVR